jgi:hypothetical protein
MIVNGSKSGLLAILLLSLFSLVVSGCTRSGVGLSGGESDGNLYVGGLVNQRVTGDSENVSVWNVWTAKDGLPLAELHCQKYGRQGAEIIKKRGITAYYKCTKMTDEAKQAIFNSDVVEAAVANIADCVRANIVSMDDLVSDASTIAEAAAQQCRGQMDLFVDAYISQLPASSEISDEYVDFIKGQFADEEKSRVLPYVLRWRGLIRKGWDRQVTPSDKEVPDGLFSQGV